MSSTPVIRRAQSQDRDGVVATIAAASAQDPGWAVILGEDYGRLAADFAGTLFDARVAGKTVLVTDDLAGVAMWDPPGKGEGSAGAGEYAEGVWARYRAIAGEEAWGRLASYDDAVATAVPAEPHWYLGVLATHPERRREGLAIALLSPILDGLRSERDLVFCIAGHVGHDTREAVQKKCRKLGVRFRYAETPNMIVELLSSGLGGDTT